MVRLARLLFFLIAWPLMVTAQNFPDYTDLYVNDFAELLAEQDETRLRETLRDLRRRTGVEFTVVTIGSMLDYGYQGAIEPFATGFFNTWGVGDPIERDGIMFLIAQDDRQLKIELGSGYPADKNESMKRIVEDVILPEFRDARFTDGILMGTDAVIADITFAPPSMAVRLLSWLAEFWQMIRGVTVVVFVALVVGGISVWLWRYKRPRG